MADMQKSEENREAAVKLLTDLLAIPSVNGRDREGEVAFFVQEYFSAHGITSRVQEIDERHANVTAFIPGRDPSKTMILNGHLDTVPYGSLNAWHSDPAVPVIRDGRIYGRGASDMKSGLAAIVFSLCALADRGEAPACSILFIGTCDEEKGGLGAEAALAYLRDEGIKKGSGVRPFMLIGEPTLLRPGTAQKGCLWLQLTVQGRTSHGAYPAQGINAIACGMRTADAISAYVSSFTHPLLGDATAQVTRIEGGVANNMTPDSCTLVMDIRLVPGVTADQVLEKGREALEAEQKNHPGLLISFDPLTSRRAIEIDPGHGKVTALQALLRKAGCDDAPIGISFFTDASILDRDDEMDICLFGPGDPALCHQPDEYVEIDRYLEAIRVLETFYKEN